MDETRRWRRWQRLFTSRSSRGLPALDPLGQTLRVRGLAASLAQFQRREAEASDRRWLDRLRHGSADREGRSDARSRAARAAAVTALHDEKRRHNCILAITVRLLGGEPEWPNSCRRPWSNLLGTQQALAADVVATAYCMSVAANLPASRVQSWLAEIAEEKRTHLEFCARLVCLSAESVPPAWLWRCTLAVSAASVLVRQRRLFRALGISAGTYWGRCLALADLAHKLASGVTEPRRPVLAYAAADGLV